MGEYTALLSEIGLGDLRQAGGKGANLGHLTQAGFLVPPGFCVLARAYETFIASPELRKRLQDEIDALDFDRLEGVEEAASRIRESIVSTPIPAKIRKEIIKAYRALASSVGVAELVAVRSSVGTNDLSATSFPGQMDTYHNLCGEEEVVAKVRECWASAFSYSAVINRHTKGIGHFDVFVAPVVQLMVNARSAGVIFTANPLNGRPDQMVINACLGLGEGVVSGQSDCDYFITDRESGEILEEHVADKRFKITLDRKRGTGNRKVSLAQKDRGRPSLTRNQLDRLVKTAKAVEEHYDVPQDIEWAFAGGRLYLLQSREIAAPENSVASPPKAPAEWVCEFDSTIDPRYDEYTLSNISEVLPGVLTPLSISDIDSLDYGFLKANSDLGLMKHIKPRSEFTFLGIFYGRCHLNLSVVKAMVSQLPGANIKDFDRRDSAREDEGGKDLWRPTPRNLAILPGVLYRLARKAVKTPGEAAAFGREFEQHLARARGIDNRTAPFRQIFAKIEESRRKLFDAMAMHIIISQLAVTYFDFLCRITASWLDDETGMLAARLVTGLHNIESATPSDHIWDLSRMVHDSDTLRELFEGNHPVSIMNLLQSHPSPDAAAFLRSLQAFLDEFGYRGIFEAEAMIPTWGEDPSYLFATIRNYLDAPPESSPRNIAMRQEREREEATRESMARLRAPQRPLLRYLVKQAQTFIALREYMKSILIKGLTEGKKVYRIISRRLAEQGMLREAEDIYFLTNREIEALAMERGDTIAVEELVTRRRREYERNLAVILPEYSKGRPRPLTPEELEPREDVEVLTGIGVSPGRVSGKARVITDPRRNAEIKPGEILVAPVTDAAWTPLFVIAAATVVDVGGPLSHGSIVAREFGIPCVVNAGPATRAIRTGQMISVDGSEGKVYLYPAEK